MSIVTTRRAAFTRIGWIALASIGLLGLACERAPEPTPTPLSTELAIPASPPESADTLRKRECIERLLAAADPRFHGLLTTLCAQWVNQAIPGVAIAVIERGELAMHVELGVRCLGEPARVEANTPFRVGSISKTFTAALLLESYDPDQLAATATLPDLVWPSGMTPPTIAALLGHRSGLGEIRPDQLVVFAGAWKPALAHSPAAGPAGEWRYSNAGYVILGALLEAKTASPYQELLASRVAAYSTITSDPALTRSPAACGHLRVGEQLRPVEVEHDLDFIPGDPSWLRPAGGVLSSTEDLARFAASLDPAMFEPGEPLPRADWRHAGEDERYGMGLRSWVLRDGTRLFGHSGDTGSFSAELVIAPDRQITVALLANGPAQWNGTLLAIEVLLSPSRAPPNDRLDK